MRRTSSGSRFGGYQRIQNALYRHYDFGCACRSRRLYLHSYDGCGFGGRNGSRNGLYGSRHNDFRKLETFGNSFGIAFVRIVKDRFVELYGSRYKRKRRLFFEGACSSQLSLQNAPVYINACCSCVYVKEVALSQSGRNSLRQRTKIKIIKFIRIAASDVKFGAVFV